MARVVGGEEQDLGGVRWRHNFRSRIRREFLYIMSHCHAHYIASHVFFENVGLLLCCVCSYKHPSRFIYAKQKRSFGTCAGETKRSVVEIFSE